MRPGDHESEPNQFGHDLTARPAEADALAFESPNMQAFYDASFSYVDGDAAQPNVAASVALRCMLRILFDYAGPIILEMQAGMGDTVFAPIYLVLRKRGVRFAFCAHRPVRQCPRLRPPALAFTA